MGLVQIFRSSSCPPLLARGLLEQVLADFRETGLHYLLHLARSRDDAYVNGTPDQVEVIDVRIREYLLHQAIPQRWQLAVLFSWNAYSKKFGDGLLAFWAISLIRIYVLEQYWDDIVLGYRPTCPYFVAGFHSEEEVYSTEWLDDLRPGWAEKLRDDVAKQDGINLPLTVAAEDGAQVAAATEDVFNKQTLQDLIELGRWIH